jgi:hypothetical protein
MGYLRRIHVVEDMSLTVLYGIVTKKCHAANFDHVVFNAAKRFWNPTHSYTMHMLRLLCLDAVGF